VVLDSGDVIAGDVLIGGYLLGVVARSTPVSHFHHVDRSRTRASIDRKSTRRSSDLWSLTQAM